MGRDNEIYAIVDADVRAFFPGGHATRVDAVRVLLAAGCTVAWNERGDAVRTRAGFATVRDAEDNIVPLDKSDAPDLAKVLHTPVAADAWDALTSAAELDRPFLQSLRGRLVEPGPDKATPWLPLAAPRTIMAALALAQAPGPMHAAEELVRTAFAFAAPFGDGPCPPIVWRSYDMRVAQSCRAQRDAFSHLWDASIDAYGGYGAWMHERQTGERVFSFSPFETDVPPMLRWAATDYANARQIDVARQRALVAPKQGIAFADVDNPFEPLLRAAYLGIGVQVVSADRVVLGIME